MLRRHLGVEAARGCPSRAIGKLRELRATPSIGTRSQYTKSKPSNLGGFDFVTILSYTSLDSIKFININNEVLNEELRR